jgi:hypothetical protein
LLLLVVAFKPWWAVRSRTPLLLLLAAHAA